MAEQLKLDTIISGATVLSHTERPAPGYPALPAVDHAPRGAAGLLVDHAPRGAAGLLVDHAPRGAATFLADHAIGIAGGAIVWLKPTTQVTPAELAAARVIDGTGQVAIPGLMNCHTHSAMTMFRNSAEDVATATWFNDHIWPMEVNMTAEDVRLGAQLAVGEMLLAGVTSFADHYFSMDVIASVVAETGARALLAQTFFSSEGDEGVQRSADFAEQYNGAADGRITTAMGPHATYTVNDRHLQQSADHARRLGIRSHIHVAENPQQTASSLASRGVTPIQVAHDTGLLETGLIIAHGAGIVADDLRWLTPYADRVGVACCDKVYLKHAQAGTTPVRMLHDAGITVGVGTDGPASHNTLDVLESVRFLSLTEKDRACDATWLTSAHALDLLTRQSAELFGQADRLGTLAPGYRADIVLIDTRRPHLQPMHDLAAALILSVKSSDVSTVLVDGRVVVENHALTTLDLAPVMAALNRRVPELRDVSHGRRLQDYNP